MSRKILFLTVLGIIIGVAGLQAQDKFYTKSGKITFFSSTPVDNIQATNRSVVCLLVPATGDLQFAVLIKGFEFKKALMQEDFNSSSYMDSNKYPKSEFKGQIVNNSSVIYKGTGLYNVTVKGQLTIHGVTKDVETKGTLIVKDGKPQLNSTFNVLLADYNITVPQFHRGSISNSIKVSVECTLELMQ